MKYCFVGPLRQNLFASLNFALLPIRKTRGPGNEVKPCWLSG